MWTVGVTSGGQPRGVQGEHSMGAIRNRRLRLAKVAGGEPKRKTWLFHAKRFRNQAVAIAQQIAFKATAK